MTARALTSLRVALPRVAPLAVALLVAALVGCGNKIGDSCTQSAECSPEGDRICDVTSPGGYCTIEGCDFGTCPDEAVCVSFYPVSHFTATCTTDAECDPDSVCVRGGKCALRSTERRYCMLRCSGHGDCRDDYECRDAERMGVHGGEPVPDPATATTTPDPDPPAFCAPAKPCLEDADCDFGDRCDVRARTCQAA